MDVALLGFGEPGKFNGLRIVDERREQGMNVGGGALVLVPISKGCLFFARQIRRLEFKAQLCEQRIAIHIIVAINTQFRMRFIIFLAQFNGVNERGQAILAFDIRCRVLVIIVVDFRIDTFVEQIELSCGNEEA